MLYYNEFMSAPALTFNSSITKKQIVAVTGLLLIIFIIAHLGGNLFIYGGPKALNAYAHKLHSLGALLWVPRIGLLVVFLIHVIFTYLLVMENIKARGGLTRYAVHKPVGQRSLATRLMPYSGAYIFFFVIWHLMDFALVDQHGPRSFINGVSYGVYGLVFNAFANPVHGLLYIVAVCFLGLHLCHGVESFFQTSGYNHPKYTPMIKKTSHIFALLMVIGYSSIPVYVYLLTH